MSRSPVLLRAASRSPLPGPVCCRCCRVGHSPLTTFQARAPVLVFLMLMQSLSSFILQRYEDLIQEHVVVTLFLTMLVGAGGNAGNQAAVNVIRGLATHSIKPSLSGVADLMATELTAGALTASVMCVVAFFRVRGLDDAPADNAVAITLSLFVIVMLSVVIGCALPLAIHYFGLDPAHAGPSIQVIMDVLGVAVTCAVCVRLLGEESGAKYN